MSTATPNDSASLGGGGFVTPPPELIGMTPPREAPRQHVDALRTLTYLMLFRAALATLLMAGVVTVALTQSGAESLSGPFSAFAFSLLTATYVATLVYAVAMRRVRHPVRFAYLQIVVDLVLATLLVHATGGAQSGFTFLYLVDVLAVALLAQRRGAGYVAAASAILMTAVMVGGYLQLIPPIPGQTILPWEISSRDLYFRLVLNMAGLAAVGALTTSLASQTRQVGERLTRHEQYAGDLATLHENTIRCLSSGLVTVGLDGHITSINDAACEILGIRSGQFFGDPIAERIPGLMPALEQAGPAGSVHRLEVDAIRPDGGVRHLGVSAGPLSDHTGSITGRIVHFQDLTELRQMHEAVQRAERLAGIGRLAAGIAHEIRNPLASISGSMELLKQVSGADGDSKDLMDIAVREVDRLNRLITDFLEYARPRGEDRVPLDLGEQASEIAKAFEQERRTKSVQISVEVQGSVGIEADAGQIRQVLWNLVRNADQAMPSGGGHITIRVRRERRDRSWDSVLEVADTGNGIADADRSRLFEPFFSTKPGGTGLGLATVARIVEGNRGTIDFTSEIGRGTTFTLRFPSADLSGERPMMPAEPASGTAPTPPLGVVVRPVASGQG